MSLPRTIDSTTPFVSKAREYVEKGWGVVPLPEKRKEYPPTGFTGRAGKFAEEEDLIRWLGDPQYSKGNIALRVGNMLVLNGIRYEVIGIDVDNYGDKKGGKELAALEKKLGDLPPTWTSSSRDDGVSGIRFFLVPYGYGFRGKASDSIEIIQRVHRYAVIYPSVHPETDGQYYWYAPGFAANGVDMSQEIPACADLAVLGDNWIDFLTDGRRDDNEGQYGIDLDISLDDLKKWIRDNFNKGLPDEPGGMCAVMKKLVAQHICEIEESPSAHDKLTKAHWSLICTAAEGHSGLVEAIKEVESVWAKALRDKGKIVGNRNPKREIERSRWGTFRKIKAKADTFDAQGLSFFNPELCMNPNDLKPDWLKDNSDSDGEAQDEDNGRNWVYNVKIDFSRDPKDFGKNDVEQARHFISRVGDNIHYIQDYDGWIAYDGKTWHLDEFALIRDLYDFACIQPSENRINVLRKQAEAWIAGAGTKADAQYKQILGDIKRLNAIVETYRNDNKIKAMLNCLKTQTDPFVVSMKYNQLNWDTSILAMPNGKVIKLDEPGKPNPDALGFTIIDNQKEFYTTQSLSVNYKKPSQISSYEKNLFLGYLNLFLPDLEYRRFVQKALGHMLIGGNPEKLAIFAVGVSNTGKSTIVQTMQKMLGDYGATFQPNSVFKDGGNTNPELGNLLHKRGIFSSESGSQKIHANAFKRNTGKDTISVTRKFANSQIIGVPHFVPFVITNQSPIIDDADEATVRRIMVLPFNTQVDDVNNDRRADVVIPRDCRNIVLHWLLIGYRMYIREGLDYENWHDMVKVATLDFASELSDIATFLSETVEVAPSDIKVNLTKMPGSREALDLANSWMKIGCNALYQLYLDDAARNSQKPISARAFNKKVREVFGVETIQKWQDGKNSRNYVGLKWKNEEAMQKIRF